MSAGQWFAFGCAVRVYVDFTVNEISPSVTSTLPACRCCSQLVPGSAFGAPGYMRISFATSMENLQEAMQRLEDLFNEEDA